MLVIEFRRSIVESMPSRIVPGLGGRGVEAGNPGTRRQVVETLRPGVVGEDHQSRGQALLRGQLQRVVVRIDILQILLDGAEQSTAGDRVETSGSRRRGPNRSRIQVERFS